MNQPPRRVNVVSHTHWDREWYLTFQQFRTRLTTVVKRVLDALENDDAFEHFLLDGQAAILDDHLEACPEDEERIRRQVQAGALAIGPWYVLPDEFLIGPEATVRNLVVGHRTCRRFGEPQPAGYMADSFGHVAQVPQLLRRAGFDSFVYQRGNGDEIDELGHEYRWVAPDGSEVLAINLCEGYCNGAGLGHEEIWHAHTRRDVDLDRAVQQVGRFFEKREHRSNGDVALLMNGCDHFPPQRELGPILGRLREEFPDTEFVHATLKQHVDEVRESGIARREYRGELLGGKLSHVLSGVWSARMPLKQRFARSERWLADYWEPLAASAHFVHGHEHPTELLRHCWKQLLLNAPHDSICGCSIDEVHRDMVPRYDAVDQAAATSVTAGLEHLTPTFARRFEDDRDTVLCVANPLPERRREVVERLVILQPHCPDVGSLRLLDEDGHEVSWEIVESWHVERFWGVDYRLMPSCEEQLERFAVYRRDFGDRVLKDHVETDLTDRYLLVQFVAELPACAHARFFLTDRPAADAGAAAAPAPVRRDGPRLDNGLVRVELGSDGMLDVHDVRTGRTFSGLNVLEDREDVGDEYDYCPAEDTQAITSRGISGEISTVLGGELRATLQARFELELPAAVTPGRKRREAETVKCPVTVSVSLAAGSPVVDVEVTVDNRARDHRLRALFPTGLDSDRLLSDGHFYSNDRPLERTGGDDWVQPAPPTWPQRDFSLIQDGDGGLAVFADGLPEVEGLRDADGRAGLALTLLRSVGWLSRDDFPTRRHCNAGPTIPTPEAQCLGEHRFRYGLLPFSGSWIDAEVKGRSRRWCVPPIAIQGVEDQSKPGGTSFLESASAATSVTAVKRHEERDTLVVRLYNLTGNPVSETLTCGRPVEAAWRVDLLERRLSDLDVDSSRAVTLSLGAHEIATVEIELTHAGPRNDS